MNQPGPTPPPTSPQSLQRAAVACRGSWFEDSRIADLLRQETVGGALLLAGTVIALAWQIARGALSYSTVGELWCPARRNVEA